MAAHVLLLLLSWVELEHNEMGLCCLEVHVHGVEMVEVAAVVEVVSWEKV